MTSLFETGSFKLANAGYSSFRINADVLTVDDWNALTHLALQIIPPFGSVVPVPTGGIPFADALKPYTTEGPVLVVDDVLTTGKSIIDMSAQFEDSILLVAFSRMPRAQWFHTIFTLDYRFGRHP